MTTRIWPKSCGVCGVLYIKHYGHTCNGSRPVAEVALHGVKRQKRNKNKKVEGKGTASGGKKK